VLTLVAQARLKVGDDLAASDARGEVVTGVRIRDGKQLLLRKHTRVRIVSFEVLGWIDVEVVRGKRAGERVRMRPSDLALLRVRSS
jgi:hypothetical protein